MQTVSIENAMAFSPPRGITHGSLVEVRTLNKETARFRVTEISEEGLGGNSGFFYYENMERLRVESPKSQVDWGMVLGGVLAVAALVFLVNNADSVNVCSGTPCPPPEQY